MFFSWQTSSPSIVPEHSQTESSQFKQSYKAATRTIPSGARCHFSARPAEEMFPPGRKYRNGLLTVLHQIQKGNRDFYFFPRVDDVPLTPSQNLRYPHRIYAAFHTKLHPTEKKVRQKNRDSFQLFRDTTGLPRIGTYFYSR